MIINNQTTIHTSVKGFTVSPPERLPNTPYDTYVYRSSTEAVDRIVTAGPDHPALTQTIQLLDNEDWGVPHDGTVTVLNSEFDDSPRTIPVTAVAIKTESGWLIISTYTPRPEEPTFLFATTPDLPIDSSNFAAYMDDVLSGLGVPRSVARLAYFNVSTGQYDIEN